MNNFDELLKEALEAISKLNLEIYEEFEQFGFSFTIFELHTNGGDIIINFMGTLQLWHADEDEREFDEDKNEWEPLEEYLRKEAQEIINQIAIIKLLI